MKDKITILKAEIFSKAKLNGFEKVLSDIVDMVISSDCLLSCCDNCEVSRIEQSIDDSHKDHIRIAFKNSRKKPIQVIWEILHEYGHYLSGKPPIGGEKSIGREEEAWDRALEIIKGFPELNAEIDDFYAYREQCLASYKKFNEIQ